MAISKQMSSSLSLCRLEFPEKDLLSSSRYAAWSLSAMKVTRRFALIGLVFCHTAYSVYATDYDFSNLEDEPGALEQRQSEEKSEADSAAGRRQRDRVSTADVFKLMQGEITVSAASKIEQSLKETPGNVSVISAYEFLHYGFFDLNEALYYQAGFFPAKDNERRTLGSRGLFESWNNNHYLLLMDGMPHNDNFYGTAYTWEVTPLSIIKSVEVVRGPGSALYGSNATNGVIAINTLSGSDMKGQLDFRVRAGSYNTLQTFFTTGNETENFQYLLAGNYNSTKGLSYSFYDAYNISGRTDANGDPIAVNFRDERSNYYLFTKVQGRDKWENLMLQVHYQHWKFATGPGWLFMVPDQGEPMYESRQIASLSYKSKGQSTLSQDYVFRFQNHEVDWNTRYAPDNAYAGSAPTGITEQLRTSMQDYFARAQFTLNLPQQVSLLGGFEGTLFYYPGDKTHYSNSDTHNNYEPYADGLFRQQESWLNFIEGHPLLRTAGYAQFASGKLFSKYLQVTVGARADAMNITYNDVSDPERPLRRKQYAQFSPRVAVVFTPSDDYALKLLAGRAFRDPAPGEMRGGQQWALAETVSTAEMVSDWDFLPHFNWKLSGYLTKFENQIAYTETSSDATNNIYTLTTIGSESELSYRRNNLSLFANYSYAQRVAEEVNDFLVSPSPNMLTWAPVHTAKGGALFSTRQFTYSALMMYQGSVARRSSDLDENPDLSAAPPNFSLNPRTGYSRYRTPNVAPWLEIAGRFTWHASANAELSIEIKNALNQQQLLIKNNMYPFDYQRNARSIYVHARLML
jgi:iron complex outermembrane receptor protein